MAINYELLAQKAADIRVDIIREVHAAASGHPGGSLSASDIVTVLYFHEMNIDPADPQKADRDKFVLSKGMLLRCSMLPWQNEATSPRKSC